MENTEKKNIICHCNEIDEQTIRDCIRHGARTVEEVRHITGASGVCGGCAGDIQKIIDSITIRKKVDFVEQPERIVCHCNEIKEQEIRDCVRHGAHTVEEVRHITGASGMCGGCAKEIQEIIDQEIGVVEE